MDCKLVLWSRVCVCVQYHLHSCQLPVCKWHHVALCADSYFQHPLLDWLWTFLPSYVWAEQTSCQLRVRERMPDYAGVWHRRRHGSLMCSKFPHG